MDQMTIVPDERADIAALAGTVVSLLNGRAGDRAARRESAATEDLLAAVRSARFDAGATLRNARSASMPDVALLDICIPEVARRLGTSWLSDEIGFADVSIAVSRLQALVARLAPAALDEAVFREPETRSALLVLPPGETHTLGLHVAAAQVRRQGLSVRLLFGPDECALVSTLRQDPYDLVMFSCPTPQRLAFVTRLVSVLRNTGASTGLTVLGGAVLDRQDNLTQLTGVDLVTNDIRAALLQHRSLGAGTAMVR